MTPPPWKLHPLLLSQSGEPQRGHCSDTTPPFTPTRGGLINLNVRRTFPWKTHPVIAHPSKRANDLLMHKYLAVDFQPFDKCQEGVCVWGVGGVYDSMTSSNHVLCRTLFSFPARTKLAWTGWKRGVWLRLKKEMWHIRTGTLKTKQKKAIKYSYYTLM